MCEIARNSVLQSGFEYPWKAHFIGPNYAVAGPLGNDIHMTNVPYIRLQYRLETLAAELQMIDEGTRSLATASGFTSPESGAVRHLRATSGRHVLPSGVRGIPSAATFMPDIRSSASLEPIRLQAQATGQGVSDSSPPASPFPPSAAYALPGAAPGVLAAAIWSTFPRERLELGSFRLHRGHGVDASSDSARSSFMGVHL
jgi:hypothetical protein